VNNREFLHALEACTLPQSDFGHAAHVRAAYLYLQSGEFAASLERIRRTIRNYAASLGKPDRYHETITVAYLALIQQHICERGNGGGWAAFARDNPELFEPGLLLHFYPKAQLESELARRVFLLPRALPNGNDACVSP
jgi:hypothetical protein